MSEEKKKVYYRCSLCFEGGTEEFYNKMISYDSLVLCPNCYKRYKESKYNEIAMLHNSIRMYRRIIEQQQKEIEEKSTIIMAGAEKVRQLEKEIGELQKEINRLNDENELLKIITRQYNSYCVNTDDEPRIILAHKHYFDSGVFTSNFISKDKIIEWLDRFDIEEDLQNEYDELLGSEAIFKFLKKLLEEN